MSRLLRVAVGVVSGVLVVWRLAVWGLDWLGRFDFIDQQIKQHGWVTETVEAVLAHPPPFEFVWTLLLISALAAAVLWPRHWQPTATTAELEPLAPRVKQGTSLDAPTPDWTIRELFFHIEPGLLEDAEAKRWEAVGSEVMDKFSTGQLRVWGRRITPPGRHRDPLAEIEDRKYWARSLFTYWFLKNDADRTAPHVVPILSWRSAGGPQSGDPDYADLRVNCTQAETMWPRLIPLVDASRMAYETAEGTAYGDLNGRLDQTANERLRHHIDAFLVRKFELWGKSPPSTVRRRIPETDTGVLRWMEGTNSLGSQFASRPGRYDDVVINRTDLMK